MLRTVKRLVRHSLRRLGYDIVALPPANSPEHRFAPNEADRFRWLTALNIGTVIDIGAHRGEFATKIRGILPDAAILSFEPLEDAFEHLQRIFADAPKFRAFNCAIGDANAKLTIFRNEFTMSSSLLPMTHVHKEAFPFTANEREETVVVKRLDDVLGALEMKGEFLIKIDVQGYEGKVIKGGEKVISRSRLLIVETSFKVLYEGQPLFGEIYDLLVQRGFRYIGALEQLASPVDGTPLQADALFLKDDV